MNLTMEIVVKTIDKLSSKIRLLNQHFTQLKIINGNQVALQQKKTNTSFSSLFGVSELSINIFFLAFKFSEEFFL